MPDQPGVAAALFEPLAEAEIDVDTIVQNASAERLTDLSFTVARSDASRALEVVRPVAQTIGAAECVSDERLGNVSIVGTGMQNSPGYASRMFRALHEAGINIEMITTSQSRITCIVEEERVHDAAFSRDQPSHAAGPCPGSPADGPGLNRSSPRFIENCRSYPP